MVLGSVARVSKNGLLRPCVNAAWSDKLQNMSTVSLAFNPLVFTNNRIASSYGKQRRVIVSVASQGVPHVPAEAPELVIAGASPEECTREESHAAASVLEFASSMVSVVDAELAGEAEIATVSVTPEKKKRNRKGERTVYLLAATAGSLGITTLAAGAVYYRFVWQMQVSLHYLEGTKISLFLAQYSIWEFAHKLSRIVKAHRGESKSVSNLKNICTCVLYPPV